jgi:hypothetical protein
MSDDELSARRLFHGVMISSTFNDLRRHREALMEALRRQKLHPIVMEEYELIPDDDVLSSSLRMVAEGSAYVGLISHRCGQVIHDPERNPNSYSVSRLEFEEAQRLELPTLVFVMGDNHAGVKTDFETDPVKEKALEEYRQRAKAGRIYKIFQSLEEFKEQAIHAAANLKHYLENSSSLRPKQRLPAKLLSSDSVGVAPLKEIGTADEFDTVKSILDQKWSLADMLQAIGGRTDRAVEFIHDLHSFDDGTWRRSLAAYIASEIQIPPEDIVRLAFEADLRWGSVTALLTLLRYTPRSKLRRAEVVLLEAANGRAFTEMDRKRLAILGLGYLDGEGTISGIIHDYLALTSAYPNEKLGPFAELAYLHCYIGAATERDEQSALRAFTEINQANEQKNHDFTFFDYVDEFQTLRPGKAVTLFRHLRDHYHDVTLLALLARLSERPNPLLASELIELGRSTTDTDVAAAALHAAAYTGAPQVVSEIAKAASENVAGAMAALLLGFGVRRDPAGKGALEDALSGGQKEAGWLNDCSGNALWSIGEIGRDDPEFAQRLLEPIREDPESPYNRGLALLGLAKAGRPLSPEEIDNAMDLATNFFERTMVAVAGVLGGSPHALTAALKGMIDNAGPPYRLVANIQRDLRSALKMAGPGGSALITLWEIGNFN